MRAFFCLLECYGVLEGLFAGKPAPTVSVSSTKLMNTTETCGSGLAPGGVPTMAIRQSPQ